MMENKLNGRPFVFMCTGSNIFKSRVAANQMRDLGTLEWNISEKMIANSLYFPLISITD